MTKKPSTSGWADRFSELLDDEPSTKKAATRKDKPARAAASLGIELLTPKEMAEAEEQTITGGIPGIDLMRRAGTAVAELVQARVPAGSRITVLAGPGNNGGDGFVAAAKLADAGYPVRIGLLASRGKLAGDAAVAANDWLGQIEELTPDVIEDADLIVDALFGAGLARAIEGRAAKIIAAVNESDIPVVAVDLPSGIDGSNGHVLGIAIEASDTVTFFRCKPGHLLMPGRKFSGKISLADIGIEAPSLEAIAPNTFWNKPPLWRAFFPTLAIDAHKYNRGHVIVVSGPMTRTGAARLAARGALRIGAGLVSVASPPDALATHAAHLTAIMILKMDGAEGLQSILADERRNAVVLGPALGINEYTRTLVATALGAGPAIVLDADALSAFAGNADRLCQLTVNRTAPTVLTPHDGEFSRLFPDLAKLPSKLDRARAAAIRAQAVVVAKGPDTVVAAPDGRASIASNAPPELATAGSGDVLAGMTGGLLAQKMPAFEAATAAVWIHGAAARIVGRGLIAEDIAEALPKILSDFAEVEDIAEVLPEAS